MVNQAFLLFVLKVFVTGGISFFLLHNLNMRELLDILEKTSYSALIFCLFFMWGGLLLAAKRWRYVIGVKVTPPSFSELSQQVMIGFFFNQLLPSSIGGDAYRGLSLRKYGIPLDWAFSSTIIDRMYGLITLLIVAFLAIPFEFKALYETILGEMMVLAFALIFVGVVCLVCLQYLPIRWPHKLSFVEEFSKTLQVVFLNPKSGRTLFVSIISTAMLMVPYKLLADDMMLNLSITQIFVSVPLVILVSVLPISFAGWGLREGAMVVVLNIFGVSKEPALAYSLIYGGLQIMAAVPGLGLWFLRKKQKTTVESTS